MDFINHPRLIWLFRNRPRLSVIVCAFNMARELPRTLMSLSTAVQRDIRPEDYEIIVVDNGSSPPVDYLACKRYHPNFRLVTIRNPSPSPAKAINQGIAMAKGDFIGVWIDGARLASPGILRGALYASRLHQRPVIGTLGFHLGPGLQNQTMQQGYDQVKEDELLATVDWEKDGYRLFSISTFAASSAEGWFGTVAETNSLFLSRAHWRSLGGYDELFQKPGGGLVNLDIWRRACESADSQVILLLGEGTFHQIHGGISANAAHEIYDEFDEEYWSIRGSRFSPPLLTPLYLGNVAPQVMSKLLWSAQRVMDRE